MENSILQPHPDGGLRKVENSRLVGIEKGHNLGITILFGHRMTMTQLSEGEVAALVQYLRDEYPQMFPENDPNPDLVKQRDDAKELCGDALVRMQELKQVIAPLTQHLESVREELLIKKKRMTPKYKQAWLIQIDDLIRKGKEALD